MLILILQPLPVVVKPSAVAGDDDVVSLFSHIVLTSIYQSVDFSFALFFIILQKESQTGQHDEDGFCLNSIRRHQLKPIQNYSPIS